MLDYRALLPGLAHTLPKNESPPSAAVTSEEALILFYIFIGCAVFLIALIWCTKRYDLKKAERQSAFKPKDKPDLR